MKISNKTDHDIKVSTTLGERKKGTNAIYSSAIQAKRKKKESGQKQTRKEKAPAISPAKDITQKSIAIRNFGRFEIGLCGRVVLELYHFCHRFRLHP